MTTERRVNEMLIRFANVNGSGSVSANEIFAKAIFRMGIPVTPKNIVSSNIQGLPNWYDIRISEAGYMGRREGIDLLVSVNPQSMAKDVASVRKGGYFMYDNCKELHPSLVRKDIRYIGIPMMQMSMTNWTHPRQQQLFKNIIYLGALATLIELDIKVLKKIISEKFANKKKLIDANIEAVELGRNYVVDNIEYPLPICVEKRDKTGEYILVDGNTAIALGAIFGGATVAAWYPITPSTSVVEQFEHYAKKLRVDEKTTKNNFAIVQAEDELAAIGMVLGANWSGARSFSATSGAGVSLMQEFIGLSYYAEVPAVLVNVQRGGPSTGMPTRTQQSDMISCFYASHGDTKHPMLIPATPAECFEMMAEAFDLADQLQTLIFVMSDLDLGMNYHMSEPFKWDSKRKYKLGKVLDANDLDNLPGRFSRYMDVDDDGITYRTIPGSHPSKGSYFTRGSSHDEYANYTESHEVYVRMADRIRKKWKTAKKMMPGPEFYQRKYNSSIGMIIYGSSVYAAVEAMDIFKDRGIVIDVMRIRSVPFNNLVDSFIKKHDLIYVVEQNKDGQFRSIMISELEIDPKKLVPILIYDGLPLTADTIVKQITSKLPVQSGSAGSTK